MRELDKGIAIGMLLGGGSDLITKTITENGTYDARDDDNADGYEEVTVSLLLSQKSISITQNGQTTYNPHDEIPEAEGYSSVSVNVNVDTHEDELEQLRQQVADLTQQVEDLEDDLEECEETCDAVREYLYIKIHDEPPPSPVPIDPTATGIMEAIDDVYDKGHDDGVTDTGNDPQDYPPPMDPYHRKGSDGNYYSYSVIGYGAQRIASGDACPYLDDEGAGWNTTRPRTSYEGSPYWWAFFEITINGTTWYANWFGGYSSNAYNNLTITSDIYIDNRGKLAFDWVSDGAAGHSAFTILI